MPSFKLFLIFAVLNISLLIYFLKTAFNRKYSLTYQIQSLEEDSNILNDSNLKELKNNASLQAKIIRYNSLKKVVEEINANLDINYVTDNLASIAFSAISHNRGACLLYLIDSHTQKPKLYKSKKEKNPLMIKAKEGDIFDWWVLRHATAILIDDVKQDFRFDLEKIQADDFRSFSSLVSAPLISQDKFLGILRLDNHQPCFYSQDDLRLMATICDVGSVALEISLLFQQNQELAMHDGLTGFFTKGYFLDRLREECRRGLMKHEKFSLLMLDIDFFKKYNDHYGHTAGDLVLKKLSRSVVDFFKGSNPVLGRFGGEEFCVFLPNADKKVAFSLAEELRERIEAQNLELRRTSTNITVSIGVAAFPADAREPGELLMKADKAMYQAKQKGRNRVCST